MQENEHVEVIKQNSLGVEVWRYSGKIIKCSETACLLEAFFNRPDLPFHGIVLREGDRFVEAYFTDRWYNIFEIHDIQTDELKCWYCNITSPTTMQNGIIAYRDLALDLLVFPDGSQLVLDEDEFEELKLGEGDSMQALAALKELQALFRQPVRFEIQKMF